MEINIIGIFLTVALAHFLALLSPGPDFVLVVKSAVKNNTKNALGVPLGIALANAVYIGLCLLGVGSILAASVPIMIGLKIFGGLFLIYLATQALLARKHSYSQLDLISAADASNTNSPFLTELIAGFMSGILNPKNLLFYLSLFTVVLTPEIGFGFKLALAIWMTVVVFIWDAAIIFLLAAPKVRRRFTKAAYYIDKVTGAVLGFIGISIIRSALVK